MFYGTLYIFFELDYYIRSKPISIFKEFTF